MSDWYMAPLRVKVGRTNWSSLKGILKLRLLYHYQRVSGESGCLSAGVDGVLAADLMSVLPFTGGAIIEKITVDQSSVFHWKWGDDAQPFGSLPPSHFALFYTHTHSNLTEFNISSMKSQDQLEHMCVCWMFSPQSTGVMTVGRSVEFSACFKSNLKTLDCRYTHHSV